MLLNGNIVKIREISEKEKEEMYQLMYEFYNNIERKTFDRDLKEKDYCIFLRDSENKIKGFSTQKIIQFDCNNKKIHGVFSGDTIIHKENWGSLILFQVFSDFFFNYSEKYENFYWFLIVKGYKTYKILPTFLKKFYPTFKEPTPTEAKEIMNHFGNLRYPGEYNYETGVIEYSGIKDSLKDGIADITEKKLKDRHIKFFLEKNPDYKKGNDLVCLASLKKENLKDKVKKILFYKG